MGYLVVIALGGFFNLFRFKSMPQPSDEEAPYKLQGDILAFVMGCIVIGFPLAFLNWLVFG